MEDNQKLMEKQIEKISKEAEANQKEIQTKI